VESTAGVVVAFTVLVVPNQILASVVLLVTQRIFADELLIL
jgi:hypothetical protein